MLWFWASDKLCSAIVCLGFFFTFKVPIFLSCLGESCNAILNFTEMICGLWNFPSAWGIADDQYVLIFGLTQLYKNSKSSQWWPYLLMWLTLRESVLNWNTKINTNNKKKRTWQNPRITTFIYYWFLFNLKKKITCKCYTEFYWNIFHLLSLSTG